MKLQVLVSTMHQTDHSLLEKMNIQSDAIVINQCGHDCIERFTFRGHDILWMSMNERGVGLSRNNALMRASGDILLFADDDVVYTDDYVEKIVMSFENHPKADLIVFNLKSQNPDRPEAIVENEYKLFVIQCLKKGIKGLASNLTIGTVQQEESTWFKGFDEKYFFDKGVLMKQCFGPWAKILLVALLAKNGRQTQKMGLKKALECAFKGADSI